VISDAAPSDLDEIVTLAEHRRTEHARAQPQFWRPADAAAEVHRPWLAELIEDPDVVSLVVTDRPGPGGLKGYLFATVVPAPPVYDPGGSTGFIDDFHLADSELWATDGVALLTQARQRLAPRQVSQIVVVCGHHEGAKAAALVGAGLSVASEWYVGPLARDQNDQAPVEIDWYLGPRADLRHLFELAEDSQVQLDGYLDLGRVLVARTGADLIGHLQLVPTSRPNEIEVKNMAVVPGRRGTGVGLALVSDAIQRCATQGWSRMVVATAAADVGNLRFYQRVGFRLLSVERDAFDAASGYPEPIVIDGIPLLDRVWFELALA